MELHTVLFLSLACLWVTVISQTTDPGLFDTESSGSGGGESSGDGEENPSTCLLPQSSPPPPDSRSERDVITEIRCHLGCVEMVLQAENISFEFDRTYPQWPTIPSEVIEENCLIFQKVQECKTGCLKHDQNPGATIPRCNLLCSESCVSACAGETSCDQSGTECVRVCNMDACEIGCQLYEDTIAVSAPNLLPPPPQTAPLFTIPRGHAHPGLYMVHVSNATQLETQGGVTAGTAFVFRVLHLNTRTSKSTIAYYWLNSLNDLLDLEFFACAEDVHVQFATVNKYGSSRLSNATIINVYGVLLFPTGVPLENPDPEFITFTITPDHRPYYWKHALINVSWIPPPDISSLNHYEVILHAHNSTCGDQAQHIRVAKEKTSIVIEAMSERQGPVSDCNYKVSVSSANGGYVSPPEKKEVVIYRNQTIPVPLNFQCDRIWNDQTGKFQFNVSLSVPYPLYWRNVIRRFKLKVQLMPSRDNDYDKYELDFLAEQSDYSWLTEPYPFGTAESYYLLTMETTAQSHQDAILIPDPMNCQFNALPLPPLIVNTIRLDDATVVDVFEDMLGEMVGVVTVSVEWVWSRGSEVAYAVRVTEKAATEDRDDPGEVFALERVNVTSVNVSVALRMELPAHVENQCVFAQVQSISEFGGVSNWSAPACIGIGEFVIATASIPTTQQPGPAALTLEVLYSVIVVGVVMLVAVVVMVVCVVVVCMKNKRASRRSSLTNQYYTESAPHGKSSFEGKSESLMLVPLMKEDNWELKAGSVIVDTKLGHGAFGDVYHGVVNKDGYRKIEETDGIAAKNVAIKVLKGSSGELERQAFLDHIEQAKLVTRQTSNAGEAGSHVIQMIGCVTSRDPPCLVCELPCKGDLLTYLQSQRASITEGHERVELTSHMLVNFAEQIAIGMEFLSSIGVVHGDLACRNMYLDQENLLKISDFGLSGSSKQKARPRAYHRTIDGRLPMRWMALESLEEGEFTSASDVWGFGVTLWEIATLGGFPYPTVGHKELVAHLEMGERLDRPPNCSQELYKVMSECWIEESFERPTFTDLRVSIQHLQSDHHPSTLLSLTIDPKLPYYNIVLASSPSSTPEHTGNKRTENESDGIEGSSISCWRGRDRVGDKGYSIPSHQLPSIVEDEQEDLDELMCNKSPLSSQTQPPTHTTQTIIVETYDTENGSTGSVNMCGEIPKDGSEHTESMSPNSASPVSNKSSDHSEIIQVEHSKFDLTNSNTFDTSNGNQVVCEEIDICPSSTDL